MGRIIVTGDTSSAVAELARLRTEMTAQVQEANRLVESVVKANTTTGAYTETVKQLNSANEIVSRTTKVNSRGLEELERTYRTTTIAAQNLLSVQRQAAAANALTNVTRLTTRPNTALTEDGAQKLRDLQAKLAMLQGTNTITPAAGFYDQMFGDLQAGRIRNYSGTMAQIQSTMQAILRLYREQEKAVISITEKESKRVKSAQDKAAQDAKSAQLLRQSAQVEAQIRSSASSRAAGNQTITQVTQYEAALRRIKKLVEDEKLTQEQINRILASRAFTGKGRGVVGTDVDPAALKAFEQLRQAIDGTDHSAKKLILSMQDFARTIQFNIANKIVNTITENLAEGYDEARKLQIKISEIRTISQDAQLTFDSWGTSIRSVSDQFGLNITDVAEGAYEALSNQVTRSGQAFEFMAEAAKFGRTTVATTAESVNLLSSVINSYKLSSADAERVSAVLFKTIDLGRVRASEMANTFGRVAFLANGLGVEIEELGAMISTLTVQGIKYSDSNTLITNVLLKLYKPTEAMKSLFKSWGVETGEQAVQMLGFANVMRRLAGEVKSGNVEISYLFNELRGLKGAEGLIGAFDTFESDLAKIKNSLSEYQDAVEIRSESPADYLAIEVNKFKNVFISDLGNQILSFNAWVINAAGGLTQFVKVISISAGVLATTKLVLIGYNIVVARNAAAVSAAAVAEVARSTALRSQIQMATLANNQILINTLNHKLNTEAIVASRFAWFSWGNAVKLAVATGVAAAVTGLGYLIYELKRTKESTLEAIDAIDLIIDTTRRLAKERRNTAEELAATEKHSKSIDSIKEVGQLTLLGLAELTKINDAALETIRTNAQVTKEYVKSTMDVYVDGMKKSITDIKKRATEATDALKASFKFMEGLKDTIGKTIYDSQYDLADRNQKILLINQESKRLSQLATSSFAEGQSKQITDPEEAKAKIEAARAAVKELINLAKQRHDIQVEMDKESHELFIQRNPSWAQTYGNIFIGNTQQLQATLGKLYGTWGEHEKELRKLQAKRLEDLDSARKKEEARLKEFEAAYKKFADFSLTDKTGAVKPQYKQDVGGGIDFEKAKGELSDIISDLQNPEFREKMSFGERIQFTVLLEQRKTQIIAEAEAFRNKRSLEMQKTQAAKQSEVWAEELNKQRANANNAIGNITNKDGLIDQNLKLLQLYKQIAEKGEGSTIDKLGRAGSNIRENLSIVGENIGEFGKNIASIFSGGGDRNMKFKPIDNFGAKDTVVSESRILLEKIAKAQVEIERIRNNGVTNQLTGEKVQSLHDIELLNALVKTLTNDVVKLLTKLKPEGSTARLALKDGVQVDEDQMVATAKDLAKRLRDEENKIQIASIKTSEVQRDAEIFSKAITDPLKARFPELSAAVDISNNSIKESYKGLGESIQDIINKMDILTNRIKDLPKRLDVQLEPIAENHKAFGGGGPRGQDRVLTWLDPREFVVNADSTAKNFSLLQRINNQPKYMSGGGMVTNIGDVNVTVEGGKTPMSTARTIGEQLQRELRRQTIRLS